MQEHTGQFGGYKILIRLPNGSGTLHAFVPTVINGSPSRQFPGKPHVRRRRTKMGTRGPPEEHVKEDQMPRCRTLRVKAGLEVDVCPNCGGSGGTFKEYPSAKWFARRVISDPAPYYIVGPLLKGTCCFERGKARFTAVSNTGLELLAASADGAGAGVELLEPADAGCDTLVDALFQRRSATTRGLSFNAKAATFADANREAVEQENQGWSEEALEAKKKLWVANPSPSFFSQLFRNYWGGYYWSAASCMADIAKDASGCIATLAIDHVYLAGLTSRARESGSTPSAGQHEVPVFITYWKPNAAPTDIIKRRMLCMVNVDTGSLLELLDILEACARVQKGSRTH